MPEADTGATRQPASSRTGLAGRALLGLLLAVVVGASACLLSPVFDPRRLPGDDALGRPAPATVKATRDYEIPDEEATARRREEAAASELPVYDQDADAIDEAAARIRGAFQLMRDAESAWRARAGPGPMSPARAEERARALAADRSGFVSVLQAMVLDEDFAALGAAGFSEEAERQLVELARVGLTGLVVQDRQLLAAEQRRGIAVREERGGAVQAEYRLKGLAAVHDVAQAREEVERAGAALPRQVAPRLRAALTRLAASMVRPTLALNRAETERRQREAAFRVRPVVIPVKRGERIVAEGERIEPRHLVLLRGLRAQARPFDAGAIRLGGAMLAALLVAVLWRFARRELPAFRPARKDAVLLALLFLATLGLAAGGVAAGDALHDRFPAVPAEAFYQLAPFAVGGMLLRWVLPAEVALLFSVAAGGAAGLAMGHSVFFGLQAALTSVAAAALAGRTHRRRDLFRAGAAVGVLAALLVAAGYLVTGRGPGDLPSLGPALADLGAAAASAFLGNALLLPLLVMALLPPLEGLFGYVTDVKLRELASLNHPALKELIVQAPGTYHHSIVMGSLVEAAAEAIGANALLAKVCAYYHDVGKTRNPLYFAENQRAENRHEQLAPSMSALIVKRHVTDGLELAAQWKLPRPVADAIAQHHGNRHVSFFWAKAQKDAAEQGDERAATADEGLYRYPGPKPQTREAALVMIADACEASSRALTDPTPERLGALVQRRINETFSEGQLDECDLTLRDLNGIAQAMTRVLEAVYHGRPEYPSRPAAERPPGPQLVARS
ncbi:MAG TPA: HDIG domain-containing protein [Anaeromyxobacteraceae bacterium]|nr:HDIG domain-containing protein [Anaeromyxobacteraceae bacterium]